MPINHLISKIIEIRKSKGFSQEYMAHILNISQVAYAKIERQETKLTVERLFEIANILEVKTEDLIEFKNRNIEILNIQRRNLEMIEVYEKLIASKDEQIALLTSLLEKK